MDISIESIFRESHTLCDEILDNLGLNQKSIRLSLIVIISGGLYGFTMGIRHSLPQALAAFVKVPLLFFVTLLICLPTLHFVGLLFGSKIQFRQTVVVLLTGVAVTAILLASFSFVSLFFLLSGSRYEFMMLLHVGVFIFAGFAGLVSISRNFSYLRLQADPESSQDNTLLTIWMFLYMFVGSQMAYLLAPFVGRSTAFFLFRQPQDNFYTYLLSLLNGLVR